jgi:hypothetical protein
MLRQILLLASALLLLHTPHATARDLASRSAEEAAAFIKTLAAQSPEHDGTPLRIYEMRDLNYDGTFEVLEHVSAYEGAPGFLNAELDPALRWIYVYRYESGRFIESTGSFRWFLTLRRMHYEHWLRVLDHPGALDPDSRGLVAENRDRFKMILRGYLDRIRRLAK